MSKYTRDAERIMRQGHENREKRMRELYLDYLRNVRVGQRKDYVQWRKENLWQAK